MTLHTLLCLAACLGLSVSLKSWELPQRDPWRHVSADLDDGWMTFKKAYNRTYSDSVEEIHRRLYWEDTTRLIETHNAAYARGDTTVYVGENKFSDLAEDEFERLYLRGLRLPADIADYPPVEAEAILRFPPRTHDWRKDDYVTPVKDQGTCGSCWAFSALGAIEARHKMRTGQLVSLSVQNVVDCDKGRDDFGCEGGWMDSVYKYTQDAGGVDSEECYPYRGLDGECRFRSSCVSADVSGFRRVARAYKGGVLDMPACDQWGVSHSMLVVGYGEVRRTDTWIVKNSWGKDWGEDGYVYMSRNKRNQCGIANFASYPV